MMGGGKHNIMRGAQGTTALRSARTAMFVMSRGSTGSPLQISTSPGGEKRGPATIDPLDGQAARQFAEAR